MNKNKPRIALLHYSCPPVIGGVESVIDSQARLFRDNGYYVRVITGRGTKFAKNVDLVRIDHIASVSAKAGQALNSVNTGNDRFNIWVDQIAGELKPHLEDIDVCLVHNVLTMHFNLALSWAIKKLADEMPRTTMVNWVHDLTLVNPDYSDVIDKHGFPWDILSAHHKKMKYVAISEMRKHQTSEVTGIPRDEVEVIPDGIDASTFLGLSSFVSELLEKEDLPSYDIVAFTPTRILRRKNLEMGIDLTKAIKATGRSIKWLITGASDPHNKKAMKYHSELKKIISSGDLEDNIVFLSDKYNRDLTNHDIRSIFRLSDSLFFLSRQEGFGMPVMEAGLSRALCVCSAIPPLEEVGATDVIYTALGREDLSSTAWELIRTLEKSQRYRLFKRTLRTYPWKIVFRNRIEPLVLGLTRGVS